MGPEQQTITACCSGPDCLRTRRMRADPANSGVVHREVCGRAYHHRGLHVEDPLQTCDRGRSPAGEAGKPRS